MITTKHKIGPLAMIFFAAFLLSNTVLTEADNVVLLDEHSNGFLTDIGYYVYGEIQNKGSEAVKDVSLTINFSLESGEQITRTADAEVPLLLEGRKSPVVFLLSNQTLSEKVSNFSISIKDYERTEACLTYLKFNLYQATNDSIQGTIENGSLDDMPYTVIYGTFYDENRKIVAVISDFVETHPGRGQPFEIKYPWNERVKDIRWYSLTAYSYHPESTVQKEVNFANFREENEGLPPILIIFIFLIVFSALVLAGGYAITKIKHRKKRKRR